MIEQQFQREFNVGAIRPIECYKEAWAMIKDQYWMVFAIVLVGLLIGSALWLVLLGPMMCGIYICLLDKEAGLPATFDRLFRGFNFFLPGFLLCLLIMIPMIIMAVLVYLPMIGLAIAGQSMSEGELIAFLAVVVVVELIFALIMVLIHSLVIFSFPLVVDRGLSAFEAVKLSARAVWHNLSGIAGLFGVGMVVVLVGYMMLCVGVYLVIPLIMAATVTAYRKVFPRIGSAFTQPPPPSYYQGL
ncbi:MAG: hypothetical protein H0V76_01180 [Blastocatellia bacterium]|nr:hypothetical protein [Blastocatellia bacterium]